MSTETGRDDFIISIRSALIKKGTRQKFSLFTLIILSTLVLSLDYFKTGPINSVRSIIKDFIYKGSYIVSSPFVYIRDNYYIFEDHMNLYEEYENLKKKDLDVKTLEHENEFFRAENERLKKLIDEKSLISKNYHLTKVLLDKQSPYLKSIIINKGFKHGLKKGLSVKHNAYYVGKIVNVNHLTSRVLLASDLNSKIPVIIEPGNINAILSGNGSDKFAELEYLPKNKQLKDGYLVYTSGVDGVISAAIPVGKIFIKEEKNYVEFFVDYNQMDFVKVDK